MSQKESKALVFGVFDNFHPGHEFFLNSAQKYGYIIAVIARDCTVELIKGFKPTQSENERLEVVRKSGLVKNAVLGDIILGTYSAILEFKPDVICLGYDQNELMNDLMNWLKKYDKIKIELVRLKSFRPEKFKSSLFNKEI